MLAADQLWMSASDLLKSQVSDGVWQSTFAPAAPVELTTDRFVLGLPNGIIRDKLDGRYRPLVEDAVSEAAGYEIAVDFRLILPTLFDPDAVAPREDADIDLTGHGVAERTYTARTAAFEADRGPVARTALPTPPSTANSPAAHVADTRPQPAELAMDQRQRYTFDSFVIGPSNRFAHAAALSVAERPGGSYNPLFIYGSAGLGKTHILRAIEHYINDVYPRLKVLYVSTETFLNEFVD